MYYSAHQPGHIDVIRQVNAGTVYRLIDGYGPVSRIALSRLSRLAPASITKIIRDLLEAQLVRECVLNEPGLRGRPATGLVLASESWHFLVLRVSGRSLHITLRDLSGREVAASRQDLPEDPATAIPDYFSETIGAFFSRHNALTERMTAITIILPGVIDAARGTVHRIPYYHARDIPLAQILSQRTGLTIYLQQDVKASLLAEHFFGAAKGSDDIIYLVAGRQIEVAVISSGTLLHKNSPAQAEMGHIIMDPGGQLCDYGHHGCLNTLAGSELLTERWRQQNTEPGNSLHPGTEMAALCHAAISGHQPSQAMIRESGKQIGRGLAMLVNLFNPEYILIDSVLNNAAEFFYPILRSTIEKESVVRRSTPLMIKPATVTGADTRPGTALIKEALYSGELLHRLLQG